ncbi:MAG: cytochrome P450, partial [Actinomycetota bacterium]|nr:cytochrome P450 [Actinomycetota bacterium]
DAGEMRDQLMIFITAGHETTATGLTFTFYLLGRHPEFQAQVRAEADAVLGHGLAGAGVIDRLIVTRMVVKEALRLYPPACALSRAAVVDDVVNGYPITAGSLILLSPWATRRLPDFWADPERFDPDRFSPEGEAGRHRHAWIPFGAGPRAYIGVHPAMLEMLIVTAAVTQANELRCPQDRVPLAAAATLRPAVPLSCLLTARRGARKAHHAG